MTLNLSNIGWNPDYNANPRQPSLAERHRVTKRHYVTKKHEPVEDAGQLPRPSNAPPSLAPVTTSEICDADVGLERTRTTQEAAEEFVRAALAYRARKAVREAVSETEAVAMVAEAKAARDAKAERLALIREVAARFTAGRSKL